MSIPINDLREMYTDVKHKNKKLKQEVERLGNELRSARTVGEGMKSPELEQRLAEKEQRLQAQEESLQEKAQSLQTKEERLQEREQNLQAKERLIREQQSNLPAAKPEILDPRVSSGNALADKALPKTDIGQQKTVHGLVSSGSAQAGSNAPPKDVAPSGALGAPQHTYPFQPPAPKRLRLVPTMTPITDKPKTADGFTEAPKAKSAHANRGQEQRFDSGLPTSNRFAALDKSDKPTSTPVTQGQTITKSQKPAQPLPSTNAPTQGPAPSQTPAPVSLSAAVRQQKTPASEEVASMHALRDKLSKTSENQESRSGAIGPIKTDSLAQLSYRLNPGASPFRSVDSKTMVEVAVAPPPPVVSRPKEKDVSMDFLVSWIEELEAEEAARADAAGKSETYDNKKIEDAAAGREVEPGNVGTRKRKFEED